MNANNLITIMLLGITSDLVGHMYDGVFIVS